MGDYQTARTFVVTEVKFEHRLPNDALGIGQRRPRISWRVSGAPAAFVQEGYEIEFFTHANDQTQGELVTSQQSLFQSIKIACKESVLVPWPLDEGLKSRQGLYARARVWGAAEHETQTSTSQWSELSYVEAGLLERADWQCERISASWKQDSSVPRPEELYRREFSVKSSPSQISRARLYVTAQGIYEAEINGRRVGDQFLAPGWAAYDNRLHYQVYDVLELLSPDKTENAIGIRLTEGWFCGRIGFEGGRRNIWGDRTALLAQLEITYQDGSTDMICSDESWEVAPGPIRLAEIYHGEKYDTSFEMPDWSTPRSSTKPTAESQWSKVAIMEPLPASTELLSMTGAPIRRLQVLQPIELITTPTGKMVLDFGQNIVGYTRMKNVKGDKNAKIELFHAEVLEKGECARRPLREADALDSYIFKGLAEGEWWEPRFTFHGYRYVQIDGIPTGTDPMTSFEVVVVHTEMEPTGQFSCSNDMLNKLHDNIGRGMRGNFVGLPTDCPQRDERLGWTGDIALFAPTACFLYDCAGLLQSWLADVAIDQAVLGGIPPLVSPNVLYGQKSAFPQVFPCAIWADVTILAPWAIYQSTGDISILATQYHSMRSWIDTLPRDTSNKSRLYDPSIFQLGDWLDPDAPPDNPAAAKTDAQLVANAFLIHSLDLLSQISTILNHPSNTEKYSLDATQVRLEFANEYITPAGRLSSDSQTAYALAITFSLFPSPSQTLHAGARLANLVRRNAFKIGTGFAGTPYILSALVSTCHAQVAYRMLLETQCPSWLYPVTMGATTMWERWDSMLPNGEVNPGDMTSFNHYALGAVGMFMYEMLAGLRCVEPGWRRCRVEPVMGGEIKKAAARHKGPFGWVGCEWRIVDGNDAAGDGTKFELTVQVPPGTTVEVVLPGSSEVKIVASGEDFFSVPYVQSYEWPPKAISWHDS
jgi:alpha-L-rhamnosidase